MSSGETLLKETALSADNPFDSGNSAPSLSWATRDTYGNLTHAPVGTRYEWTVTEAPKEVQARDFDSGKPAFWPDGNPKKTIVIGVQVNGEDRTLWAPKPSALFTSIKEALTTPQGVVAIAVGGKGWTEFTGYGKAEAGKNPQKLYKSGYTPPNAFADPTAGAPVSASNAASADADRAARIAALSPEDRALLNV